MHHHSPKKNNSAADSIQDNERVTGHTLPAVHPFQLKPVRPPKAEPRTFPAVPAFQFMQAKPPKGELRTLPAMPVLQNKLVQRKDLEEEELPVQQKNVAQLQGETDDPALDLEEELLVQGKFSTSAPGQQQETPVQKMPNNTGLPDNLKEGVENLSGFSMDDVKVHYNSGKPAQLQALAYAQGTDIHVGPGQEKHLPHEAWHVVQQKQGRVQPTMQMKGGVAVNDDKGLESEADVMGSKASTLLQNAAPIQKKVSKVEMLPDNLTGGNKSIQVDKQRQSETWPGKNTSVQCMMETVESEEGYSNDNGVWIQEKSYVKLNELIDKYDLILEGEDFRRGASSGENEAVSIGVNLTELSTFVVTNKELKQMLKFVFHPGKGNDSRSKKYGGKTFMQILSMCADGKECHNDLAKALRECLGTLSKL